jgi:dCMP deaminase
MEATTKRPTKDEYYLDIARKVSKRGTCLSTEGGAVIVKEDQIISTGYIGAPRKTKSCLEKGYCLRRKMNVPSGHRYELCSSVHTEQNAIINAARSGVSLLGGTMYLYIAKIMGGYKPLNSYPCFICKKMIVNAGLEKVIAVQEDGSSKVYLVADWVKEWQEKEMVDDAEKYDTKYTK